MSMSRLFQTVTVGLLLSLEGFRLGPVEDPASSQPPPRPVATVNGEVILDQDLATAYQGLRNHPGEAVVLDKNTALGTLIDQVALRQAAEAAAVTVSEAEVQQVLEIGRHAQSGEPVNDLYRQARSYLLIQKFANLNLQADRSIKHQQLLQYYQANAEDFQVEDRIRVLEIMVAELPLARRLERELKNRDFRGFREAARKYSRGTTAAEGGEIGVFERGQLPQHFESLIFKLRVGAVSSIFESERGYHLFMVEEKIRRHAQKFYEVQEEIFELLVREQERKALDQFLASVLETAQIEILEPGLVYKRSNHDKPLK